MRWLDVTFKYVRATSSLTIINSLNSDINSDIEGSWRSFSNLKLRECDTETTKTICAFEFFKLEMMDFSDGAPIGNPIETVHWIWNF